MNETALAGLYSIANRVEYASVNTYIGRSPSWIPGPLKVGRGCGGEEFFRFQ
jgi:hypothetical protein